MRTITHTAAVLTAMAGITGVLGATSPMASADQVGVSNGNCTLVVVSYTHGSGGILDFKDFQCVRYTCA